MFKQSSSRNQRSKGFKIKHALQIALLLAVCIWLIYQVKHTHDKKKAFEESASKLSEKIESQHDIIKFGRKDLNPRVERTASENERHGEEEETQEEEEEEIKHEEEEEQQEEENKPEESENEGRGDGDDEIDEHEQQQIEEEAKREEDFVDEEERDKHDSENEIEETQSNENEERETEEEIKESEEKVNEEETKESEEKVNEEETKESAEKENEEESKENEEEIKKIEEKENEEESMKREDQIEEQDHDRNTQDAREEQYKGDDASSAVFRDTQTVSTEAESGVIGNSNEKEHVENLQVNELGMGNKTNNLDEVTSEQKDSDLKAGDGETTESNSTVSATYSNSTSTVNANEIQEKGTEENVSKLEDESLPILTMKESIDLQEVNNSSTSENMGTLSASLQNGTDITEDQKVETTSSDGGGDLDHKPVFLDQTENSNMTAGMSRLDSNSSLSTTTQNEDASKKESEESSSNSGTVVLEEQKAREEDSSESSTTNENGDGDQNEKSETTTEAEDNSSSSTTNDNEDLIDSNSTEDSLFPEVKEAQTDLGTLPEIETEGNNSEDVAAER